MSGCLGPRQIGELDSGWWSFVRFLVLFCHVGARVCLGARRGEGVRPDPTAFPLFLFGVASFGGVVREARDKALAKVGSRPDYFSICGFWLLLLLAKFTT